MKPLIVPFFIPHQGCPHACVFCNQRSLTGSSGALPDADTILETITSYRRTSGKNCVDVAFYGGTFTALPYEKQFSLLQPLQSLLELGQVGEVRVSTRPDAITSDTVVFLKKMQVGIIELGVQSMDDETLRKAGRGHRASDTVDAVVMLKRGGFKVGIQLMPGLPGGDRQEAINSLSAVLALAPAFLRIYPTVVVAETGLAELFADGDYTPWSLSETVECCAAMLHMAALYGVPVIRLGLQPTDELSSAGAVIAGPFHPALRHLAESARWSMLLQQTCSLLLPVEEIILTCAPGQLSNMVGCRRQNMAMLSEALKIKGIKVKTDAGLTDTTLRIETSASVHTADLLLDLKHKGY